MGELILWWLSQAQVKKAANTLAKNYNSKDKNFGKLSLSMGEAIIGAVGTAGGHGTIPTGPVNAPCSLAWETKQAQKMYDSVDLNNTAIFLIWRHEIDSVKHFGGFFTDREFKRITQ